jgi:hypothetical protein
MVFLIIGIYLLVGVIVNLIALFKEPILLHAGFGIIPLFIIGVVIFPWVLWVVILFPNNTGRWI